MKPAIPPPDKDFVTALEMSLMVYQDRRLIHTIVNFFHQILKDGEIDQALEHFARQFWKLVGDIEGESMQQLEREQLDQLFTGRGGR